MIKNIIFDIGNVLASFRPREVLEEMGLDETEVNVILDATVRGPYWVELDRGVMEEAEVIEAMRSRVPQRYLADFERFFAEETGKLVKSLPYAADWLKGLKERGYHVYLLCKLPGWTVRDPQSAFHFPAIHRRESRFRLCQMREAGSADLPLPSGKIQLKAAGMRLP